MSQVLRNVKALGAEQKGTVQTGALSPSCLLAVAPLNFRCHPHSENTSKASYQCWLFTLCISTTLEHLLLHFPETYKLTAFAALQQISMHF